MLLLLLHKGLWPRVPHLHCTRRVETCILAEIWPRRGAPRLTREWRSDNWRWMWRLVLLAQSDLLVLKLLILTVRRLPPWLPVLVMHLTLPEPLVTAMPSERRPREVRLV